MWDDGTWRGGWVVIVGFVGGWDDGVGGGGVSVWMVFLSVCTCLHVLERVAARTRDSRAVVSVAADCSVESVRGSWRRLLVG